MRQHENDDAKSHAIAGCDRRHYFRHAAVDGTDQRSSGPMESLSRNGLAGFIEGMTGKFLGQNGRRRFLSLGSWRVQSLADKFRAGPDDTSEKTC